MPVMSDHDELLSRVLARADRDHSDRPAPLREVTVRQAEVLLGCRLPPLLAALYQRVGNGGFGPDYHLLPLMGDGTDESAVGRYLSNRKDDAGTVWAWPEGMLPILHWGCAMYAAVDCRSADAPVLLFDPALDDPHSAWYLDSPSLAQWLEHWIADTGWWVLAEQGEDVDMIPWPQILDRATA